MVNYLWWYLHEPYLHHKGYTNDYWELDNITKLEKRRIIFGDEELFAASGQYFQKLFRYQRKLQAQKNRQLIKQGKKPMRLCFHYPYYRWRPYNYRLKTFDEVKMNPFGSLYTHSENIYCIRERSLDAYLEQRKTHPDFTLKFYKPPLLF